MSTQNILNQKGPTPQCSVFLSTNQTIATATTTKITFNTVLFDITSNFDTTNNRFVPNVAGRYIVCLGSSWTTIAGAATLDTFIYVNGSPVAEDIDSATFLAGASYTQNISFICDINGTTDYIEGFVRQNTVGNLTLNGGVNYLTNMSISLLR